MPVNDDIDLNSITDDQLQDLIKTDEEAAAHAKSIEESKEKAKKDVEEMKSISGGNPLHVSTRSKTELPSVGPNPVAGLTSSYSQLAIGGTSTGEEIDDEGGFFSDIAKRLGIPKEKMRIPLPKGFDPRKTTAEIDELKKKISGIEGPITKVAGLANNPMSAFTGGLGMLGTLGVYGMAAMFGLQMAQTAFSAVQAQFGPGGLWDTRKLVLNNVKTIAPLNTLIQIRSGQTYFSDDAGQTLRQGAPEMSNTRQLRNGHLRYIQLYQGT